jgi:hypothetical protein
VTENLEKIFELADLMSVVSNQKMALKEEFEQSTLFFHNGGCFKSDPVLISFVTALQHKNQKSTVLIDSNSSPIVIEDLDKFLEDILNQYFNASNKYIAGYQKLRSSKSITSILNV